MATHKEKTLEQAVRAHLGGTRAEQNETLREVAQHGAAGGGHSFTYYSDTVRFARKYRKQILAAVAEYAGDAGTTVAQAVQGFRCLSGDFEVAEVEAILMGDDRPEAAAVFNALAWFALETVAYAYDAEAGAA
jgi:hypothetical protein